MKNKIKTLIIALLICLSAFVLVGCQGAKDIKLQTSTTEINAGEKAYSYMQTLATDYKSRFTNSGNDLTAASWISEILVGKKAVAEDEEDTAGLGFVPTSGTNAIAEFKFTLIDSEKKETTATGYNVSATKRVANSKGEIIIGTYYDNCYGAKVGEQVFTADGSYESGASVAALLALAEEITKINNLAYDITVVFFGGGSMGHIGADKYSAQIDEARRSNIKMMINFSQIVGGENTYMYSRDFATDYNNFFYAIADANSATVKKVPAKKNIANATYGDNKPQNYTHIGMLGNHFPFFSSGIPTVNFMSFNWSKTSEPYNTEFNKRPNVYQTDSDNFATLLERCGGADGVKTKLNDIVKIVALALTEQYSTDFDAALAAAPKQEIDKNAVSATTATAISISTKVLLVVIVLMLSFAAKGYIQKHKEQYKVNLPNTEENVNQQMPQKDVFDEFFTGDGQGGNGGSNGSGSNGDRQDNNSNTKKSNSDSDVFEGF